MSAVYSSVVPAPPERVWDYFASPGALVRLSPPFLPLRPAREVTSLYDGTAELAPGTGLPGPLGAPPAPRWVARHDPAGYREGSRFVDRCDSSPYREITGWVHRHELDPEPGPDGQVWSRVTDRLSTRLPRRLTDPAFAFRHRRLPADLAAIDRRVAEARESGAPGGPLTVAVTGSGGLVGTQLVALLGVAGHHVVRLVRHETSTPGERHWDTANPAPDLLDDVDVLVHLAGEGVAGRFTDAHVAAVRDSRVGPTRALAELVAARGGATTLVCASAIGYYGPDRGTEELDETSPAGTGVLADVVLGWEAACEPARGVARVVNVRTGIALSTSGGMLGILSPVFRAGLGGPLAGGRAHMSWISLDDLVDVYHRAVVDTRLDGVVNAVAPGAVDNAQFTRELGRSARRPAVVPIPGLAPELVFGREGATETALADQLVRPAVLTALGHRFRHPDIASALRQELGREPFPTDVPVRGA